jgi:hypothetical protein
LKLRAEWSKAASGFNLKVLTHEFLTLDIGNGLETSALEPTIQTQPVQLVLSSNLKVPVANSVTPLVFKLKVVADDNCAKITGEMNNSWSNPLGAGANIKVGPKLDLNLDIEFAKPRTNLVSQ